MSTPFQGFTAPSYTLRDRWASVERLVNWYCLPNESQSDKKAQIVLEPSPACAAFGTLPVPAPFNQPARGLLELRGQVFGVNGNAVYSIDSTGTYTLIGTIDAGENDGKPCCMVANGNGQVFISSGGWGYVIPPGGAAGSLIRIGNTSGFQGASFATFQDGYILVVKPDSNTYQISGDDDTPLGDCTKWDAANVSVQAGQADHLRAILSSREYVRILGARRSQIHQDVGSGGIGSFPFASYNQTFIETGIASPFSLVDLGESHIWIGEDARGQRACWRDPAFSPQRVSNFALEQQWQNYAKVSDAVAFAYIWRGHLMYQITFPSAIVNNPPDGFPMAPPSAVTYTGATWVYDVTASAVLGFPCWHERSYQSSLGFAVQRSEMFHAFAFGLHLVASSGVDGNPGAVYQYSDSIYTDCGVDLDGVTQVQQPIVRTRIAPHIWNNFQRVIINRLQLEVSRGVGLDGAPAVGVDPQIVLQVSRDAGNTWGNEFNAGVGRLGAFSTRVLFNRLGYGRDLVFKLTYSDPTYISVIGAELDVTACLS